MQQMKRLLSLLLTIVLLLGVLPVQAWATEEAGCAHTYEAVITEPTCVQGGFTTYTCTQCGDTYTADETDPTGNCVRIPVEQVDATCQTPGTAAHYKCENCAALYLDEAGTQIVNDEAVLVIPLGSCRLVLVEQVDATCTAPGTAAHYACAVCGALYWDEQGQEPIENAAQLKLRQRPHSFGPWQIVTEPAPETPGLQQRVCRNCGDIRTRTTDALAIGLSTPALTVRTSAASGKPALSWKSVENATGYWIYLVDTETGERSFLTQTSALTYTYQDAVPGEAYAFCMAAVSSSKCSEISATKSVLCKCAQPVIAIHSEPVSGKPIVSWDPVEGTKSYILYRSASSSESFKVLTETTELTATDDSAVPNKTYYYRMVAVGEAENTDSAYSKTVKHICTCAQPVVTTESGSSGGIRVKWEKVAGAKFYYVYRSDSADGTYTQLTKTTSTSYTDTKAPKNQVSFYKVKASGSNAASTGAFSEAVSAMNHTFGPWLTVVPSTPDAEGTKERTCTVCGHTETGSVAPLKTKLTAPVPTITAEVVSGKPTLRWKAVNNASEYWIYLWDGQEQTFVGATETRSYVYEAAVPGTTYTFVVRAVNSTSCSPLSEAVEALCKCQAPEPTIHADPESGVQTMVWEKSEGAASYRIYRSVVQKTDYALIDTTETATWTVTDETPGVQYYYVVQAQHGEMEAADSILSAVCCNETVSEFTIHAGQISEKCNKIVWKKLPGAKKYIVYRSDSADGEFKKLATVKKLDYVDLKVSNGSLWYYRVEAVLAEGSCVSNVQAADGPSQVPVKIYISPSCQTENVYAYGKTTEAKECRKIGQLTVQALQRCGFAAITNVTDDMDERMEESNVWGADLHVPIHSNAFNKSAMGTQIYHDGVSGSVSKKASAAIFNVLAPLSPGSGGDFMRANPGLYEIRMSDAPTAYIEVAFHDTVTEAKWIINNKIKIAEAICKGICNLYGVTYIPG